MIDDSVRVDLREKIGLALAIGDEDFDAVVEGGVYYLEDEDVDTGALAAAAKELAVGEFAAYVAEQQTWPEVLDADRLVRAFRELDMAGIVARANFTCCQTCGTAEIGGEIPDGSRMRGYVFCHRQDVEAAVEGGGVYLSYGAFGDDRSQDVVIGEEVSVVLRRHGLATEWNGDVAVRIDVPMTWRRRLWLERPDRTSRCSRGRHVNLAEAEEQVGVLAREDRVDLACLGDIKTKHWG